MSSLPLANAIFIAHSLRKPQRLQLHGTQLYITNCVIHASRRVLQHAAKAQWRLNIKTTTYPRSSIAGNGTPGRSDLGPVGADVRGCGSSLIVAVSVFAAAVLAGCAGGNNLKPLRVAYDIATLEPGEEIAAVHPLAPPTPVTEKWWTRLGDAQLDRLMEIAG